MLKRFLRMRPAALAAVLLIAGVPALFAQPEAEKGRTDESGVLVVSVVPGSPAAKAGVARGDIILSAGGTDVNSPADLAAVVEKRKAGESLPLKVAHGDAVKALSVTLAEEDGRPFIGIIPAGPALGWGGPWMRGGPGRDRGPWMRGGRALADRGALITRVEPAGPAETAGLKAGEVIVSVDGTKVGFDEDLADLVGKHKPGDALTLSVAGPGAAARDVTVTLAENPSAKGSPYLGVEYAPAGMRFGRDFDEQPGLAAGVMVRRVAEDSPAAKAGLKPRDVIVSVESVAVRSPADVAKAVSSHKPGDSLALAVSRIGEDKETSLSVTLGEDPKKPGQAYLGIAMGYPGWRHGEFMPGPLGMGPRAIGPRAVGTWGI